MYPTGYELSARSESSRQAGTPERPLSDLGLRGYLQFWTSVLVRYFRLIFYTRNDPRLVDPREFVQQLNKPLAHAKHSKGWQGEAAEETTSGDVLVAIASQTRATDAPASAVAFRQPSQTGESQTSGQVNGQAGNANPGTSTQNGQLSEGNVNTVTPRPAASDGTSEEFEMRFSLAEIANATRLREDDVAFTMLHAGLARFRKTATIRTGDDSAAPGEAPEAEVVISPALVEEVASRMRVKPPVMSRIHCLL